ncbi:hypothetical protein [Nocardiopsis alba]|uniref:hypothetical protein n=1 Tax=Nocardiopsis alba TaxID=53437 RepID=UPI0033A6FEDB
MPKRNKRKRASARATRTRRAPKPQKASASTGPLVLTLPSEATPLLRLEILREAGPELVELARRYWTPKVDGGWAEPVAAIGSVWKITSDLEKVCTAYLLSTECSACEAPLSVANRSGAVALGGHDLRRSEARRSMGGAECSACERERKAEREREHLEALERERKVERVRRGALTKFLERGGFGEPPSRPERLVLGLTDSESEDPLGVRAACLLYALIRHARTSRALPALADTSALLYGWMYPAAVESALLKRLFERGWILVDPSAVTADFDFDEDGRVRSFAAGAVPLRLATSPDTTLEDLIAVLLSHSARSHMEGIVEEIREMEVFGLYLYLNRLLSTEYRYPWVSEAKRVELYGHLRRGLEHFTYGQMVCLCWRAVDTAASWKERKGLAAAHASSASVTTLGGKIDYALEHPASSLPEYSTPRSHPEPPGLSAGRDLLGYLEILREQQRGCPLHDRNRLPCACCLGALYGGGEEADLIREYFAELGVEAVSSRPDLATKRELYVGR